MNYIFFIGGSGARAYTSFLHACAAGVVHAEQANVMLLDADTGNAACENSIKLFQLYKDHRRILGDTWAPGMPFRCDIHMSQEAVVSPINKEEDGSIGEKVPYLGQIAGGNDTRERALRWFYTEEECNQDLTKGFYAHPNIGCVFFQNFKPDSPINNFIDDIIENSSGGTKPHVVIVGSVFGGTGAAGIPSVLKMLKERCNMKGVAFKQLYCCGVLITPYFEVSKALPGNRSDKNELTIDSDKFYCGTKTALPYYQFNDDFEEIYLVGQNTLDIVNNHYADGGKDQNNKPHIVEVLAALAVKDSLEKQLGDIKVFGEFIDRDRMKITWDFLGSDMCSLAGMLRTQMILETAIYPCAINQPSGHRGYQWRKIYHIDSAESQKDLETMWKYSEFFLDWFHCILNKHLENSTRMSADTFIKLCDTAILDCLHNRMRTRVAKGVSTPEYAEKGGWRQYQKNFANLVDTAQKIEYVAKKIGPILSALGVLIKPAAAKLNCAGLFLKLFNLAMCTAE